MVLRSGLRTVAAAVVSLLVLAPAANAGAPARGFCCNPTRTIRLTPTEEGVVAGMLYGVAEIDECLGLSFLHLTVVGRVPDQTVVIPVMPDAIQPWIGEWITMTLVNRNGRAKGESLASEISAAFVAGRELDVTDENFTPLLIGQF